MRLARLLQGQSIVESLVLSAAISKKESRMRIRSITANNFKSLADFELKLAKFSCLIGLNSVGKSTVLQFIDFLSQLVRGDVKGWLEERQSTLNSSNSSSTSW
jgi:ABC-type phosphate/phosphonate transport system ATPase subunit